MDPRIGSLFDRSPARLAAISSHRDSEAENDAPAPKAQFAPWSSTHYNTLAPFSHAHDSFHRLNGPQIVEFAIAPLFKKWNVTSLFGVSLLYPSITLAPDSIPVSRGSTLTAWPQSLYQSTLFADRIQEAAWRLVDNRWTAYEFACDGGNVDCTTLEQASETLVGDELQGFLDAFAILLVKHDLHGVLGLRTLPSDDFEGWMECGHETVGLRFSTEETGDCDDETEVCAWFFNEHYMRNDRSCLKHVVLSKPSGSEGSDSVCNNPKLDIVDSSHVLGRHEPEPELLTADGWIPSVERPEDFDSTLRKFSNTMVVEDIEVMGDGTLRFHGRSVEMPQRPKSH